MKTASIAVLVYALLLGSSAPPAASAALDPASFVDPLVGTSGNGYDGSIDTFPGADVPFGMMQWSPDTPSQPGGGGYNYNDSSITGFSLTHLSGPGCSVFGDVGILPATGIVPDPATASEAFSHASESASPGYYTVSVGMPSVRTELTVTPRTGLGRFTFPATPQADILVNASSNQAGVGDAEIHVIGHDELAGSATSGWFCGMPGSYTVYFALRFDRPFSSFGTWRGKQLSPQSEEARGSGSGAWVTFDTTANPVVRIKAAISFVSLDEAEANQRTEATTWDFDRERRAAAGMWTAELSRVRVEGGAPGLQRTFYTALYHCMLHPNIYSDAGGSYRGFDGRVHYAERGHAEYANFSGWDIYRTEIPLLAVLEPQRTSDMMRSLVDASSQMGWLPKWSLVNVETGVMGGDPSDPMLAAAYAFGARGFDTRAALAAMVKGASLRAGNPLGQGWYEQRPALDDYVTRGYVVNVHTTNVAPLANGASLTMEYALDDFAIARVAGALGDRRDAAMMSARAQNWSNLFDRSAGLIEPRDPDGAFEQPPITEAGQSGFQEGNAAQYTWMVPQDGAGLIRAMGGRPNAVAKLDAYFSQIDAGQNAPFAWLGNEPSIGSPWAYLSAGAPWKAQRVIRDAMTQLWGDTPDGIPGNDDLGTMSAWYVLCALGLYPQEPAVPYFDLGAPSFARARVRVPGGASIDIDARGASAENAYVQSVSVGGTSWHRSWVGFSPDKPLRLDFTLGAAPNIAWGADPADAPPSYESTPVRFPASTSAQISLASTSEVDAAPGGSFPLRVRVTTSSTTVTPLSWRAGAPDGFVVTPSSGRLNPAAGSANEYDVQVTVAPHARTGIYHVWFAGQTDDGALLPRTDAVVRVARPGDHVVLAYAVNLFDNSIEPIDVASHATGAPIIVGELPRALAVSPDGKRVYVSDNGANVVSVVDTNLRRVIATVSVGRSPWGIGVTPDGATVWVANNGDDTVQPIDTATLQAGKPIAVGHTPETLTIVRDGSRLYVADPGSDDVTPVDLARRAALAPIAVGMRPRAITVSPDGKSIYASNYGSASVTPIDVATGRALPAIHAGAAPRGLAVSPDGKWLYVTDFGGGAVSVVDAATGATVKSIPVGLNPVAVAFDPRGTTAFVVNLDDNDCVAIDAASGAVSPPIRLGDRPIDIATNGGGGDL